VNVLTVLGARPQFIKAAPVSVALASAGHEEHIVHTGQHYDADMSDVFFDELPIPIPRANLGIGSGSHGKQTARMLEGIDYTFKVPAHDPTIKFPLEAKRHLLLFFKEALHNIIKHARATHVEIRVAGSDGSFDVIVHDNGIGMNPTAAETNPSHLEKLRSRARRIPGEFDITTAPGDGTQLRLHVSLN